MCHWGAIDDEVAIVTTNKVLTLGFITSPSCLVVVE